MLSDPGARSSTFWGTLHIVLFGTLGVVLIACHTIAMTAILRKFEAINSSQTNHERSKIMNLESRLRQLRREHIALIAGLFPLLFLFALVPVLRNLMCYFLALAWACAGVVTLRFIYFSQDTVYIYLRRNRMEMRSMEPDGVLPRVTPEPDSTSEKRGGFSSSVGEARAAISRLANRHRRKPKFINAMTRVTEIDEEKTIAYTIVDEPLSNINSNEFSSSNKPL